LGSCTILIYSLKTSASASGVARAFPMKPVRKTISLFHVKAEACFNFLLLLSPIVYSFIEMEAITFFD
jgi:hypothetical protein